MLLKCSNDLQKALKIKAEPSQESDRFFTWYAHTFKLGRRNCVVIMNSATQFNIVLYGLQAKDYPNVKDNILDYIKKTLESYCVSKEMVDAYVKGCGDVTLVKNANRSDTARLNKVCTLLKAYRSIQDEMTSDELLQKKITYKLNKSIYDKQHHNAQELFFIMLKEKYKIPLYDMKMYRLKITLNYPEFEISREIIIPGNYSFQELHLIIQTCFNWKNYHLYEFAIAENGEPTLLIHPELEDMYLDLPDENTPSMLDTNCTVADIFSQSDTVFYRYDFGDDWLHKICLLEITDENENICPVCLKAIGTAPPEDCGGIYGYTDFLKDIENGDEEMIQWAKSMEWKKQSADDISLILRWRFG